MSDFSGWLKHAWTDFLSWFGVEEQRVSSFFYPIIKDAAQLAKTDALHSIIEGVPVIALALVNGPAADILAAEEFLLPLLEKEGITLAKTTIAAISTGLVAQAQTALDKEAAAKAAAEVAVDPAAPPA